MCSGPIPAPPNMCSINTVSNCVVFIYIIARFDFLILLLLWFILVKFIKRYFALY